MVARLVILLPLLFSLTHLTQGGRMFDVTSVPTETVVTEAGANLTLACPGVTEHSLVSVLEWYCEGCSHSQPGSPQQSSSHHGEVKLVEFRRDSTTVWQNRERVTLNSDTYALYFHPVVAGDTGEYQCLVNDRRLPESILKLVVQDVPDPPGRPLILAFTSRAVNLSWAPPLDSHNSRITHYVIHTRVGEEGEWDTSGGIVTENNRTSYQVVGLQPFTVYSFRVVAVNALGRSPPSKESYYFVTLREVPDGKPTITAAQNASSTSIRLAWRPPTRHSLHGEFLGYRLAFRPRDKGPDSIQEIYIRDPNIESYTIQHLQTFTQYLVSLQVFNPEGLGPPTTVAVITDEGVPEKPRNVTVSWVTDSMMELSWSEPAKPNGKIEGYRIYYMWRNFTEVETVKQPLEHMKFALSELEAFTEYKVWVKPFTWKNEGESSDAIVVKTDVRGPNPPRIVNVSCLAEDVLLIAWQRPTKYYNSIDFFYIDYRSEEWKEFEEITVTANEANEQFTVLPNMTTNSMYEIRVRGGTRSVLETGKVYKGQFSDSRKILMKENCEKGKITMSPRTAHEFTPTMVAITVCASFALLVLLIAVVVWRRCFQGAYYYLDDPPRIPPLLGGTGWEGDSSDELKRAIPAHLFPKHVSELHADGDIGFSKEYELIQSASVQEEFASVHSQHADNKLKNRYLNIVAYDHSRVRLQPMPGQKKCVDYVNANYIDGFRKAQAYIGTQGPLPSTFDSFWRMVWEHNVHIIVMITNLVERGRKKCDMYWPKEGSETYGVIQVRLLKEDILATYTVRTFLLKHLKFIQPVCGTQLKKKKQLVSERTVYHYHYTNWPDHGTPSHPLPVLSFVKKSSAANPPDAGPIIVHCSAGVGRTGTYIVLDAMLRQIRARGDLNIFGFLNHIRKQRNYLVQTEEQYIFIHDAMLEAIESGETNVNIAYLSRYIHSLLSGSYADERSEVSSLLERQYKLVTQFLPKDFHTSSALKAFNLAKNRNIDNVCTDAYRVSITPKPGIEGSEYINASFAPGFRKLQEFILTQHPLESTTQEFWQMCWDHNVQTVVVLTAMDDLEYPSFWPGVQEGQDYETFRVNNQHEGENNGYYTRDVSLQSLQDDYDIALKMVHAPLWPHSVPPPISSVLELINFVQECVRESHSGPVAVIDRFGGTEAATFCCLATCMKQIHYENHADIYMYAKLYHEQRPGVWRSPDDYLLLYRCVESMVSTSNGGTLPTPTSPSPLLPPPSIESFLASQISAAPNGHINGIIIHNGNGRIPPEGLETRNTSGDPMV